MDPTLCTVERVIHTYLYFIFIFFTAGDRELLKFLHFSKLHFLETSAQIHFLVAGKLLILGVDNLFYQLYQT